MKHLVNDAAERPHIDCVAAVPAVRVRRRCNLGRGVLRRAKLLIERLLALLKACESKVAQPERGDTKRHDETRGDARRRDETR